MNIEKNDIDILKHVESLTEKINDSMEKQGKKVFERYPVTFGILILSGVIMVSEGVKIILGNLGLFDNSPYVVLGVGILILVITGSLYRKLNK